MGLRHVLGRRMECHRVVRPLPRHSIPTSVRLRRHMRGTSCRRLEATCVRQVGRSNLGATVMRTHSWIRRSLPLHRGSASVGDERLCLRIEGMTIVASGNGVLALRVVGVHVHRKLAVLVGDSHGARTHLAGVGGCSRRAPMRRIGCGWRVKSRRLPATLWVRHGRRRPIHTHGTVRAWWIALLSRRRRILVLS